MVRCDKWYDNTWWEAELPSSWSFRQDRSIKNWPYVFESANGARLWVGASKHNDISGWDFSIAPPTLSPEQQKAFLLAAADARMANAQPVNLAEMNPRMLALRQHMEVMTRSSNMKSAAFHLTRRDLGELVGFTYPRIGADDVGWSGCFSHDPWMLRLSFISPADAEDEGSRVVMAIIASIRFKGPATEIS
jgi:hypothetical protein